VVGRTRSISGVDDANEGDLDRSPLTGSGVREDSQLELFPGATLAGKYRLIAEIGRGGMGSVWRAERLGWDAPVAVKLMSSEIANRPEALARFEREVRLAAGLRSPHVVQVLDHGVDTASGTPFIVMELLDGESLARRLKRSGRLSPGETFHIISDIVRALGRAHAAGIVHRDLKPDNVYLVRNEDESLAKILDFGVAKWTAPSLPESGLTRPGSVVGTPFYMSPEQIQGSVLVDHRADLWSLSTIVCECLTGRRPFEAPDFAQLAVMLLGHGPRPLPSSLGPVPPGFDAWFARATTTDISRRFQTARELLQALAPLCGASASSLAPDSFQVADGARAADELWMTGDAQSMAAVSNTARLFAPARLWGSPLSRLITSSLVSFVVVGGGLGLWYRQTSAPAAASGAAEATTREPSATPTRATRALTPSPSAVLGVNPAAAKTGVRVVREPEPNTADAPADVEATSLLGTSADGSLDVPYPQPAPHPERGASRTKPAKARTRRSAPAQRPVKLDAPAAPIETAAPPAGAAGSKAPPSAPAPAGVDVNGRRIRTSLTASP
jgi:eukaryotic-like serine/threonine-protein kinase